ncbi:methyl-accepting chemotaxis protein [Aestuariibacter sp. AA17]|uniref:Methyl-accepting chemotaxis protein n=1 Tax=Fluctibacter corallii TaxID=2984329 RepID=A0ABT3A8F7_9ALTE|nr:methyl-accepting chemotaxis protein [Aestuariibacter sp. AA17]MCV2884970.1 methyl-accepting chemotaxis protein [Aestuariibacter sp. AA17]
MKHPDQGSTHMFHFIRNNIRNKLLLLISTALFAVAIAGFGGFSTLNSVTKQYSYTVNHDMHYITGIAMLNSDFKTQVQEWKNTLLRGADQEQRDKYWGRFLKSSEAIQKDYSALLADMPANFPSRPHLQTFADSYPDMVQAYKQGYEAFVASGFDHRRGDKAVKGIDRIPAKSLSEAVSAGEKSLEQTRITLNDKASMVTIATDIVMLVVIVVSVGVTSWFIDTRIVKPLNRLSAASKRIAKGDFTDDISVVTEDQIGDVSKSFVLIQHDLSQVIVGIQDDLARLGGTIDTLQSAFHNVKLGIDKQVSETEYLVNHVTDMTQTNHTITDTMQHANEAISNSVKRVDEGRTLFNENVLINQRMSEATHNASDIIETLKRDSDDIGSIVNVINGIAEQTNLLALNAAIEAARAGKSGRGFAVVADEVRTLANKTQESTKQISDNIAKLQEAADKAVVAMDTGKEQAQVSVEQAKKTSEFVTQLREAFEEIRTLNQDIELAVQDQDNNTQRVNQGLKTIEGVSESSASEAISLENAAGTLKSVFENIAQATASFKPKP